MEDERPIRLRKFKECILNNLLTVILISSIILGCVIGLTIRYYSEPLNKREGSYISFLGNILIRLLKCAATPLIIACIIVSLGSLDLAVSKRICWHLIVLVFGTKIISTCIGLMVIIIMRPGSHGGSSSFEGKKLEDKGKAISDIFLDMFRNIITNNMMRMYLEQYETVLTPTETNTTEKDILTWNIGGHFIDTMNLLGMIFLAIVIGLSLAILQNEGKGLYAITSDAYLVSMKIAIWILWISPFFVFFLILSEIMKIDDFGKFLSTYGLFVLTVHVALILMIIVEFPLLLFLLTGENPFKFFKDVAEALLTAYATSSSMAAMPVLLKCLLQHGLDPRIVRFVVPIGININKDGTTTFLVCATVFVAQLSEVSLSFGHLVTIVVLATFGGMASAAVPFASIVVLLMMLNGLGLKQDFVAAILAVDFINDRGRTMTNVVGNTVLCKILVKWNDKALGTEMGQIENE